MEREHRDLGGAGNDAPEPGPVRGRPGFAFGSMFTMMPPPLPTPVMGPEVVSSDLPPSAAGTDSAVSSAAVAHDRADAAPVAVLPPPVIITEDAERIPTPAPPPIVPPVLPAAEPLATEDPAGILGSTVTDRPIAEPGELAEAPAPDLPGDDPAAEDLADIAAPVPFPEEIAEDPRPRPDVPSPPLPRSAVTFLLPAGTEPVAVGSQPTSVFSHRFEGAAAEFVRLLVPSAPTPRWTALRPAPDPEDVPFYQPFTLSLTDRSPTAQLPPPVFASPRQAPAATTDAVALGTRARAPDQRSRRGRAGLRRRIGAFLLAVLVVGAGAGATMWTVTGSETAHGVVTAPIVPLYAAEDGHVTAISAVSGAQLAPGREILSITVQPPDTSARDDTAARLQATKDRVTRLAQQATEMERLASEIRTRKPDTYYDRQLADIRLRLVDVRAQQADSTTEVEKLSQILAEQDSQQQTAGQQVVASDRDAVLWSLLATDGMAVTRGTMVAEIADCSRLYVRARADAALRPGGTVQVVLAGVHAGVLGHVRADAQMATPTSAVQREVIVDVDASAMRRAAGNACPLGRNVTLVPDRTMSRAERTDTRSPLPG